MNPSSLVRLKRRARCFLASALVSLSFATSPHAAGDALSSFSSPATQMFLGAASAIALDHGGMFYNPAGLGPFKRSSLSGSLTGQSRISLRVGAEPGQQATSISGNGTTGAAGALLTDLSWLPEGLTLAGGYYTPNDTSIDQDFRSGEIPEARLVEARQTLVKQVRTLRAGGAWSYALPGGWRIGQSVYFDRVQERSLDSRFSVLRLVASDRPKDAVQLRLLTIEQGQFQHDAMRFLHGLQWTIASWLIFGASHEFGRTLSHRANVKGESAGALTDGNGKALSAEKAKTFRRTAYIDAIGESNGPAPRLSQTIRAGAATNLEDGLVAADVHWRLPFRNETGKPLRGIANFALAGSWAARNGGAIRLAARTELSPELPLRKHPDTFDAANEYIGALSLSQASENTIYSVGAMLTRMAGETRSFNRNETFGYDPILKTQGWAGAAFLGVSSGFDF